MIMCYAGYQSRLSMPPVPGQGPRQSHPRERLPDRRTEGESLAS